MPRLRFLPATRWPRMGFWPTLALAVWGGLVALTLVLGAAGVHVPSCLFAEATGVPCPTCGGTRAVGHALSGDLGTAFVTNPLLVSVLLLFLVSVACRLATRRRPSLAWPGLGSAWKWSGAIVLLLANWAWVIATLG